MSARADLCGGRSAMIVPTATSPSAAVALMNSNLPGSGWITGYPETIPTCLRSPDSASTMLEVSDNPAGDSKA